MEVRPTRSRPPARERGQAIVEATVDVHLHLSVDFNVPLEDGKITYDSRIVAALPTIAAVGTAEVAG